MRVLYVGQEPSRKNTHENVAFSGTQSGATLNEWLKELPGTPVLTNASYHLLPFLVLQFETAEYPIIAVGKEASIALAKLGCSKWCSIPHPSRVNRQLNDPSFVAKKLDTARKFIAEFK